MLTLRQKTLRLIASSILCGLTISFLVGEMVDAKAAKLVEWKEYPAISPSEYLPLNPSKEFNPLLASEFVENAFISANSIEYPQAPLAPTLNTYRGSSLLAEANSFDQTEPTESVLQSDEVKPIVEAVEYATKTLSKGRDLKDNESDAVRVSSAALLKKEAGISAKTEKFESSETKNEPIAIVQNEPKIKSVNSWVIKGSIHTSGRAASGHYEIGLFDRIDPEGNPVGAPLVQTILPENESNFILLVPNRIEKGYLYGSFVSSKGGKRTWIAPPVNPWLQNETQIVELVHKITDTISTASSAAALDTLRISGTVTTAFVRSGAPTINQEDVLVKVRGRKDATRTDKLGRFQLEIPRSQGSVFLEFLKAGYHPLVQAVSTENSESIVKVEIASREAVDQLANMVGVKQVSSKAIYIGKAQDISGNGLAGFSVRSSIKSDGPYYFSEDGLLEANRRSTSTAGRFVLFNIEAGTGTIELYNAAQSIAPFQFSTVEGGEWISKPLTIITETIRGRLFNPVKDKRALKPIAGARVRVEGTSDWAATDAYGAFSIGPIKWIKEERAALEVTADKYLTHRFVLGAEQMGQNFSLFAFPSGYFNQLARSMDLELDPYAGIIMGKVTKQSLRIDALAEHSVVNVAKDFYFDAQGRLRGSHSMTDANFGTYVIFNVPKGRALLQGNDSAGILRYGESAIISPSTVSVIMN